MPKLQYHCDCGETCSEDELRHVCISHETRIDPAEYAAYCPSCGTDWENMTEEEC